MKIVSKRFLAVLLTPVLLSACAGNEVKGLQQQVAQQNQTIQSLQMQLSGVQPAQADTWSQVQGMRQDLATLRGDMDNMNNALQPLGGVAALGEIIARHERALRLIETQLAMDLQLGEGAAPAAGMMGAAGAAGIAGASGTAGIGGTGVSDVNAAGNPAVTAPVVSPTSPAKPVATDTAQALYDSGINAFNNRNYTNALNAFTDFTKTYPKHSLISNAWFWQAESQYQLKNYAAAALAYEKVISGFPNSPKAPSSYLKQAMSFLSLNKKDAAKERLNQLISKYPKAPEATRAKQILKEKF